MRWVGHQLTRVGAGCTDQDPLRIPGTTEQPMVDVNIILIPVESMRRVITNQVLVPIQDPDNLYPVSQEGDRARRDNRVGRGRRSSREQNGNSTKTMLVLGR